MRYLSLVLLFPYIVGFTPPDSSYSECQIGLGGGQYTYADCSGEHIGKYYDFGARVTHKFEAPFRIGATISSFPIDDKSIAFVFPDIAFDNENFSIGTTGLRLGGIDKIYWELKWLDEVPFASGRGLYRVGLGLPITESGTRLWIGTNRIPYMKWGFAGGVEIKTRENQYLFINGRYGERNRAPEFGLSLGIKFNAIK